MPVQTRKVYFAKITNFYFTLPKQIISSSGFINLLKLVPNKIISIYVIHFLIAWKRYKLVAILCAIIYIPHLCLVLYIYNLVCIVVLQFVWTVRRGGGGLVWLGFIVCTIEYLMRGKQELCFHVWCRWRLLR